MRRLVYTGLVHLANALQGWFVRHPTLYRLLLAGPLSGWRWRLGVWRAWVSHERTYRQVPAYRAHVDAHGGPPALRYRDGLPDLSVLPETDKASYVQRYGHAQRCVGGRLPTKGVMVDESSGSSGQPTSWIRGPGEREVTRHMLQLSFGAALGKGPTFVINAFALGAWATGLNVTLSLHDVCVMKSTGPDIDKIVHTLTEFGPEHDYVVLGYPPFLKTLADDPRVDWDAYRVRAVFGGEGISESLRRYLKRFFSEVLGSYGASDLEINMAAESPFTVGLRQELQRNAELRQRLTDPRHGSVPMVFQYNPLAYHLDTNPEGELIATLTRPSTVAPKVRYNIHDIGHVARFEDVIATLTELGVDHLTAETKPVALPLLFLYGRSDLSIDYYGANVTPDSVREILYSVDELAPQLESFRLIADEDEQHNKTLQLALELADGTDPLGLDREGLAERIFDDLAEINRDFRNAYRHTATAGQLPRLSIHAAGTGPFAGGSRIKHQYVASNDPAHPATDPTPS